MTVRWTVRAATGLPAGSCHAISVTGGLSTFVTTPPSKIKDFAHLPLHRGSEASAAGGGCSELSEWQRSAEEEAFLKATKMPGTATGEVARAQRVTERVLRAIKDRPYVHQR